MPDVITTDLKITQMADGGQNNTWGDVANANFQRFEDKLVKRTPLGITGGTSTLSDADELVLLIDLTGALVSNATIVFSGRKGFWLVRNATTGSFTTTCKVSGQPGVAIGQNAVTVLYCNGTDMAVAGTLTALSGDLSAGAYYINFNDLVGVKDANGNKVLVFGTTAAAVNYLELKNAAAGGSPQVLALGADADIGVLFTAKGAGVFKWSATLAPGTNDTGALGTAALSWSDLFLASGAVINFNNGNVTITHAPGVLSFNVVPDVGGSKMALLGTEDQVVTGGGKVTEKDLGTIGSGTVTLSMGGRSVQKYINHGAHVLSPGANQGSCFVDIVNDASAGVITKTGWTATDGDAFDTTNASAFRCFCSVGPNGSYMSVKKLV